MPESGSSGSQTSDSPASEVMQELRPAPVEFTRYASKVAAVAIAVNSLNPNWEQTPCSKE
jgi:hypothetical protein